MSNEKNFALPKKTSHLMPHDVKELEKVSNYAALNKANVEKLPDNVKEMGFLRKLWDSKVPEKNLKFYYFFSLSVSDKEVILDEIEKYQEFYKELSDAMVKIYDEEEQSESENMNPYLIIHDLNVKLSEMAETAKQGKLTTASSTLYDLHKSFIEKHEMLENMIKRVECVTLKEGLKIATDGWKESTMSMDNLQKNLKATDEKYSQMCSRFEKLMVQNESLIEQQKVLLSQNKKMEKLQESLLQENAIIKDLLNKNGRNNKN